jgi:hypothetical protein
MQGKVLAVENPLESKVSGMKCNVTFIYEKAAQLISNYLCTA